MEKYTTKDEGVIDLGNNKYCVINEKLKNKLDPQKILSYQKSIEKGTTSTYRTGIKKVEQGLEVKTSCENRLHHNNTYYINDKGVVLIIFTKETTHFGIKKLAYEKLNYSKLD